MNCKCIYRGEGETVTCDPCAKANELERLRARVGALETERAKLAALGLELARVARMGIESSVLPGRFRLLATIDGAELLLNASKVPHA